MHFVLHSHHNINVMSQYTVETISRTDDSAVTHPQTARCDSSPRNISSKKELRHFSVARHDTRTQTNTEPLRQTHTHSASTAILTLHSLSRECFIYVTFNLACRLIA